jgi:hypothetical protein
VTEPLFPARLDDHAPWPAHPDDQLIEVTALGDTEPRFLPGMSEIGRRVNLAAAAYIAGSIPFEEFERRVDEVLAEAP